MFYCFTAAQPKDLVSSWTCPLLFGVTLNTARIEMS